MITFQYWDIALAAFIVLALWVFDLVQYFSIKNQFDAMNSDIPGRWRSGELKIYAVAIRVINPDGTGQISLACMLYDTDDFTAEEEAYNMALDYYPIEDGFTGHYVTLEEITPNDDDWGNIENRKHLGVECEITNAEV